MAIDAAARGFLNRLLETPSPSGYEQPVQRIVLEWARSYADEVRTDLHGNVIAIRNPNGHPRILLDGHCDQIGLMVQHIHDDGFLHVLPIGGWDAQILLGQNLTIWSESGPIHGVIARKPKHLLSEKEMKETPEIHEMWIDIGSKSKAETAEIVKIGDPVTFALGYRSLRNELISGPKMDDSTGVFVVFEALRRLQGTTFAPALFVVSAVQEEIGLRGAQTAAFGVDPHVGIAVDVTHATDCPTIDKRAHADIRLGGGPVVFRGPNINPVVHCDLVKIAGAMQLPIQHKGANKGTANDANVIQLTRAGVAACSLGIPNRYMHSPVETVALSDLDVAAELLAEFVRQTSKDADFRPTR